MYYHRYGDRSLTFGYLFPQGSGSIHETVLWLNMRNPMAPQRGGKMRAAINDWRDFFAVRFFYHEA